MWPRYVSIVEAFGWPMGPAYLSDVIGLDTMSHIIDVICAGYPQRMTASPLEPTMPRATPTTSYESFPKRMRLPSGSRSD